MSRWCLFGSESGIGVGVKVRVLDRIWVRVRVRDRNRDSKEMKLIDALGDEFLQLHRVRPSGRGPLRAH